MADIFDDLLTGRNQGQYRPSSGTNRPSVAGNTGEEQIGKVEMLERNIVYGPDLRRSSVPSGTASASSHPSFVLRSPSGEVFGMSDAMLSRHLLLAGGTGMGKSNTFYHILSQLIRKVPSDAVILIFDTKGDFCRKFYDAKNPRHILIGNEDKYRDYTRAWSIFEELNAYGPLTVSKLEIILKELTAHLFRGRESQNQPFFNLAAADLFVIFTIDYIIHKRGNFNNEDFVKALKKADAKRMIEIINANPRYAYAASYLGDPERLTPQALGVLAFLQSMVSDLFVGIFAEKRRNGTFSMTELVSKGGGRVVFLEYDLSVGDVLGPMYSLLIDQALKTALSHEEDKRPHLYLFMDEIKLAPDLQHIEHSLNYGRSKGIRVCAGIQSVSQIYEVYEQDKGKSILSGFMNCFAFKTLDKESREYTSGRFGQNYSHINYRAGGQYYSVPREGFCVEDWDILKLQVGDAYIDLLGYPPFKFHFSEYQ